MEKTIAQICAEITEEIQAALKEEKQFTPYEASTMLQQRVAAECREKGFPLVFRTNRNTTLFTGYDVNGRMIQGGLLATVRYKKTLPSVHSFWETHRADSLEAGSQFADNTVADIAAYLCQCGNDITVELENKANQFVAQTEGYGLSLKDALAVREIYLSRDVEKTLKARLAVQANSFLQQKLQTRKEGWPMLGGGPYDVEYCPLCGCIMWNGRCENKECEYHWHPREEAEDE